MKMVIVFLMSLFTMTAFATVVPQYKDIKLASQAVLEYQRIATPIVAATNYIKTTYAGPTSAAALTLTSFSHQPDVPRNLTITPTGTTGDVESCVITVTGTNIYNAVISEAFTFAADANSAQTGLKAFKSVTSIAWPASCESGGFAATWIVGVGDVLGLKSCVAQTGDVAWAVFDGTFEGTRPTCVVDATHVENNTCDINGTLNGSKNVDLYYVQNFRCHP